MSDPGSARRTDELAAERAREQLGLSKHHARLMDVCFKYVPPRPLRTDRRLNDVLTVEDLEAMSSMVERELLAGLEKERNGPEDDLVPVSSGGRRPDPFPYDVCLMETTLEQRASHNLAVCVPHKGELVWYDGDASIRMIDEAGYRWRVASIAGAARILDALEPSNVDSCPLMRPAMERARIVDAVTDTTALEATHGTVVANLNVPQRRAVATVLDPSFTEGFFTVQGPPGTGKSTVIAAMIAVVGSGVLVAAPSNAAVANVAVKAYSTLQDWFGLLDFAVFGENCHPSAHFLSPRFRGEKYAAFVKDLEGAKTKARADELKMSFIRWLHLDESKEYTNAELSQLCPYVDTSNRGGRRTLATLLSKAKIVFSTLNSTGSWTLRQSLSAHTLLLDEAGQCPEAEFYVAATVPGVRRIVVIGDPKQLPSTVVDLACQTAGYGVSWLGKVFGLLPHKVHLLSVQYRMDPLILEFPNEHFYGGRIESAKTVLDRVVQARRPFCFVDTCGYGREEMEAFSWMNAYEVATIQHLLFTDPDIKLIKDDLFDRSVIPRFMVISPYKAQVALLKNVLRAPKGCMLDIATVDSFQGQEAHIVFFATVRTRRVGFVDSPERINVALTRSISILRVIGDLNFFRSLHPSSTLRKLATFAGKEADRVAVFNVRPGRWAPPNWNVPLVWDVCWSSRYWNCLTLRAPPDQNIFMNTLHAIASADTTALNSPIPPRETPTWYMSALKGFTKYQVVWMASLKGNRQTITAEYAGSRRQCLHFLQVRHSPPFEARIVRSCLSGLEPNTRAEEETQTREDARRSHASHLFWKATNTAQHAIASGVSLPLEGVQLDPVQDLVARTSPPLLIESRSGTGKTLVLVQHAAYFATREYPSDARPACFVTVSSRLCTQLESKYNELNRLENLRLPPTLFFSFRDLIEKLLYKRDIDDFKLMRPCTFVAFDRSRKSHERFPVDSYIVESEIGGVIVGSLLAGDQNEPLSRAQYLEERRSNVDRDPTMRNHIYDCFERYERWKAEAGRYDVGDIVLRLLREEWDELFTAGKHVVPTSCLYFLFVIDSP
jgi:AAA domain